MPDGAVAELGMKYGGTGRELGQGMDLSMFSRRGRCGAVTAHKALNDLGTGSAETVIDQLFELRNLSSDGACRQVEEEARGGTWRLDP